MLGQEFTGVHFYGYNNLTGKYDATWVYTGATGMMTMSGSSKDDGKTWKVAKGDMRKSIRGKYVIHPAIFERV